MRVDKPLSRPFGFSGERRIRKNGHYKAVYSAGVRKSNGAVVVYTKPNNKEHNAYGLSVSKKVGNAVTRNRLRRIVKENVRLFEKAGICGVVDENGGRDVVVVLRPAAREAAFGDLRASLLKAFKRLGLLSPDYSGEN